MPTNAYIAIGSNLGDRIANLSAIHTGIASIPEVELLAGSPVYETEPVDVPPDVADKAFLNAVLIIESDFDPYELHDRLRTLENELGRTRDGERNMPRSVDIDIIYAGQVQIDTPELTVPHPRWAGRRFVVQPLADVRPDLILPGQTRSVREILLTLPDTPKVLRYSDI